MSCHARQFSDQMVCRECGLTWDINDPDPPACIEKQVRETTVYGAMQQFGEALVNLFKAIKKEILK